MPQQQPAFKRLVRELLSIQRERKILCDKSKPSISNTSINISYPIIECDDIYLQPTNPDKSILSWTALIRGPIETPYEDGVFQLSISCSSNYPLLPPNIRFITKIFHPNINFHTGEICLDILKKEWSPAWGLQAACRAVLALLSDPDADSPLNCDAGNMVRGGDMLAFRCTARMYTIENAMSLKWPDWTTMNEEREVKGNDEKKSC